MPTFVHTQFACRRRTIYRQCAPPLLFIFSSPVFTVYNIIIRFRCNCAKYLYIIIIIISKHGCLYYGVLPAAVLQYNNIIQCVAFWTREIKTKIVYYSVEQYRSHIYIYICTTLAHTNKYIIYVIIC